MRVPNAFQAAQPPPPSWPALALVPTHLDPVQGRVGVRQRGYWIRDASTDRAISHDELAELVPGAVVFHVAGTSHRLDALQAPAFAPGRPLLLVPEPTNPHDRNAVGVWDNDRQLHVGYVPKELAPPVSRTLRRGVPLTAACHFEFLKGRQRVGLSVLLAPTGFMRSLAIQD